MGRTLDPYHLAAGIMFLGLGVVLLGALIVLRERLARRRQPLTPAQKGADTLLMAGGLAAMLLGLGAIGLGVF